MSTRWWGDRLWDFLVKPSTWPGSWSSWVLVGIFDAALPKYPYVRYACMRHLFFKYPDEYVKISREVDPGIPPFPDSPYRVAAERGDVLPFEAEKPFGPDARCWRASGRIPPETAPPQKIHE